MWTIDVCTSERGRDQAKVIATDLAKRIAGRAGHTLDADLTGSWTAALTGAGNLSRISRRRRKAAALSDKTLHAEWTARALQPSAFYLPQAGTTPVSDAATTGEASIEVQPTAGRSGAIIRVTPQQDGFLAARVTVARG